MDSNEIAFRTAAKMAVLESMMQANPMLLEPLMSVEIDVPQEFQGAIIGGLNRRKGAILSHELGRPWVCDGGGGGAAGEHVRLQYGAPLQYAGTGRVHHGVQDAVEGA